MHYIMYHTGIHFILSLVQAHLAPWMALGFVGYDRKKLWDIHDWS